MLMVWTSVKAEPAKFCMIVDPNRTFFFYGKALLPMSCVATRLIFLFLTSDGFFLLSCLFSYHLCDSVIYAITSLGSKTRGDQIEISSLHVFRKKAVWTVLPLVRHQCSIHWENSRLAHGASKRKWTPRATRDAPKVVRNRV